HMTVAENVEYGLKIKKVDKKERRRRAGELLELVRLPGMGDRKPAQLSGGQRQRVALARALVNRPRALLLDEPLGALDLKLRHEMQVELKALQAQVGITFVLVTHDQEEALSMSDRIAVFHRGRIEQIGTPEEVYERPATAFVAGFVGFTNLLSGPAAAAIRGTSEPFSVRPEKLELVEPGAPVGDDHLAVDGVITSSVYLGAHTRFFVTLDGVRREDGAPVTLTVLAQNHVRRVQRSHGERVRVTWPKGQVQSLAAPGAESLGPAESIR
ncbi:ABC transporter ATP-binding protein, partial [Myxococcota bacterium]|nr:ABC transporter ATP-binding protein [Myxococcota bacterium]